MEGHAEPFPASATMQQLCPLSDQDPQRTRWRCILCDAYSYSLLCISWFSTLVFAGYIRIMQLLIIGHVTVSSFLQLVPNASPQPTILPDRLMALVEHQPDWASLTWRVVFCSILHMDSSHTPKRHTSPEKPIPEVL